MEEIKARFLSLREAAERRLRAEPEAQLAVALRSATGGEYAFTMRDWTDPAPEEAFLQTLRDSGDTVIGQLVYIWQDGCCLDLPCMRFRQALLALDERNADTRILLNGMDAEGRLCPKPVRLGTTVK